MTGIIIGNVDLAMISLLLFTLFFIGLVVYLQREGMREGYPLEDENSKEAPDPGLFPMPKSKTFRLPHGRGEVTVPRMDRDRDRKLAMRRVEANAGSPYEPTGNALADGVGPAAYALRRDVPELDSKGHPKIVPMRSKDTFSVSAGRDPRGLPVISADGVEVGTVSDLWVDDPEQYARYVEYTLKAGGKRLVPVELTRIRKGGVTIDSLYAAQFAGVPAIASDRQITKLEEEKVCAYYCGGKLYAAPDRLEPAF